MRPSVHDELAGLAAQGHELASHGPDHGRLPDDPGTLLEWLRRGRTMLEDLVQLPVQGFRSPRFDVPPGLGLARYRAAAGRGRLRVRVRHQPARPGLTGTRDARS